MYSRELLKYRNDQRGKRDGIDSFLPNLNRETHRITRHYSAKLQTAKQTLTTSKILIKFSSVTFPCHLRVNRNKLALISRRYGSVKGAKD